MSQNSDLFKENAGFQFKDCINGEICSHNDNRNCPFTRSEQRQILDLLLVPMSPNRISRHLSCVFRKNISPWKIKKLLLSYGIKIRKLNERFDRIARRKIIIIHIDETFKGQKISVLILIDAITGYILHLEWLERRTEEAISKQLSPLRELLKNVILVITDGASYFLENVKKLCPDAFHQICLIHVMRGLYTYLQTYKTNYQEKLRTYQSLIKTQKNIKMKKKEKRYSRKKLLQKLNYWKQKRRNSRDAYRVTPYQKGILDRFPELRKINEKINLVRAKLRSLEYTIEKLGEKEISLKVQTEIALEQKNKAWGEYMVKCRLLHQFYQLFNLKEEAYQKERFKLLSKLQQKNIEKCEFSREILRILLKAKHLDTVNKAECPVQLNLKYINTNAIESINSRIRPFLECLRKITNSLYIKTYFDFLRLYLNTTRPFSGIRSDTSPLERYGYDLRGKDYLDLLQDGLPPGPQYEIYKPHIDLSYAAPNMVNNFKF
ncbi:MAG: transposase [Promethearchaeota archaeon]